MPHLPLSQARVVETPAAVMRTYASPSTAVPAPLAVWRTEMAAGIAGPQHVVDVDQVVVVVTGRVRARIDGVDSVAETGDSILLPAGVERRLVAEDADVVTVTASLPDATARIGAGEPVPVPWTR